MKKIVLEKIAEIESEKERLLRYLFVKAAPVLTGVKPAVLMRYTGKSKKRGLADYRLFKKYKKEICSTFRLQHIELKHTTVDIQVLFYNGNKLSEMFIKKENEDFLYACGYCLGLSIDEKLQLLRNRFTSNRFPHEIGLFLGYPLKDVKAFSSGRKDSLNLKQSMWRVFDNATESLQKMEVFRRVEFFASDVAIHYDSTLKCIERLKTFAGTSTLLA